MDKSLVRTAEVRLISTADMLVILRDHLGNVLGRYTVNHELTEHDYSPEASALRIVMPGRKVELDRVVIRPYGHVYDVDPLRMGMTDAQGFYRNWHA